MGRRGGGGGGGGGGGMGSEVSVVHLRINIWIGTWGRWNKGGMRGEGRDEMGPPADQY